MAPKGGLISQRGSSFSHIPSIRGPLWPVYRKLQLLDGKLTTYWGRLISPKKYF